MDPGVTGSPWGPTCALGRSWVPPRRSTAASLASWGLSLPATMLRVRWQVRLGLVSSPEKQGVAACSLPASAALLARTPTSGWGSHRLCF